MDAVERARAISDRGLEGNVDQGGARQVTLIEREVFDRLRDELSPAVDPAHRRANLLVSGVRLMETRGRVLQVGPVRIRIRGETRPCERMNEAVPGLRDALDPDWCGGVFGVILDDGEIGVGDPVTWAE
jgi:MOSC domain-containing protein YiiM